MAIEGLVAWMSKGKSRGRVDEVNQIERSSRVVVKGLLEGVGDDND